MIKNIFSLLMESFYRSFLPFYFLGYLKFSYYFEATVQHSLKFSLKYFCRQNCSLTYNVYNSVRLENVPVSSSWILLSWRYLRNERNKELGGKRHYKLPLR